MLRSVLPHTAFLTCAASLALASFAQAAPAVLKPDAFEKHVTYFNEMEPQVIVPTTPKSETWPWLRDNVPWFECPDKTVERNYWFRWWALRLHLRPPSINGHWTFTEFITRTKPVSSALGHHLMELRWLRDQAVVSDYVRYWIDGPDGKPQPTLHKYSQWLAHALWSRWFVTRDTTELTGLLDKIVVDYRQWEVEQMRPDGLFWQTDVRDAMEESVSGGRKLKNVRPTISVYMYGNALAIAEVARLARRDDLAQEFSAKAAQLRRDVQKTLWNESLVFFGSVNEALEPIKVREEIGFIPWYFNLPEAGQGYERAWAQLTDEQGFKAPWGITTTERRESTFRSRGTGTCEWDGAVWPYASAQTITALANVLRDYPQDTVTKADYYDAFLTYTKSHVFDGLPYLGEYQDEKTGAWLKGRDPRSYYYNHSTYADLVISGVVGLRPRADNVVEVSPLLPEGTWDWFCLDNVRYHGRDLTILWDKDGSRYGRGAGLQILVDGKSIAKSATLERITVKLP
ncbi:MGH1-like glycoside hydrolase domain-containing protein [Oleiharenicola lentus]|uniref:MGH1-like glycoside hydrolase domain-containing protein n=1 Tax=Oleiharenicola lentus TaxID=2508720 RepID=UPI003F6806D5